METSAPLALATAGVSIVMKEALYRYTVRKGKRINSQAVVANAWHHRTHRIGNHIAIEVHVRMDGLTPLTEAHATASEIEKKLKEEFGKDTHIGIHLEPFK